MRLVQLEPLELVELFRRERDGLARQVFRETQSELQALMEARTAAAVEADQY